MSDRHEEARLDRLVRSAARHDPAGAAAALRAAGDDLLEEIMRTEPHPTGVPGTQPAADVVTGDPDDVWTADVPTLRSTRRPASRLRRAAAVAAVAAAVAGAAFGASRLPFGGDGTVVQTPAAVPTPVPSAPDGRHPWIALTGWTLLSTYESPENRSFTFGAGARQLSVEMYPEDQHEDRVRQWVSDEVPVGHRVDVPGGKGVLFDLGRGEFVVVMDPREGVVTEFRGPAPDRDAFEAFLADLRWVDDATWESLVPAGFVTPARELATAREMLADVDLPPGLSAEDLPVGETNDAYQFGAHVVGTVVCRWIGIDLAARESGDIVAQERADGALAASRAWDVLRRMDATGDYPEVVWEYADALTKGTAIPGGRDDLTVEGTYREGLGCED